MNRAVINGVYDPGGALSRLVLLGTVHMDPFGARRLGAFLRCFPPDLIFLEMSPYSLRYRKSQRRKLLRRMQRSIKDAARECGIPLHRAWQHPEIQLIRRQINLPYEYRVSAGYARRSGVSVLLVDLSEFSRDLIVNWRELIDSHNLSSLLAMPSQPRRSAAALYDSAARRIHNITEASDPLPGIAFCDPAKRELWEAREAHISRRILAGLMSRGPARPLYIGGFQHLLSGGAMRSLREILDVPPGRCLLLDRATQAASATGGMPGWR
ncbi:MAG: hypothetical protein ABFD98_12695 [Syntrophobacteraceae bacterium]|nr:hypothetical protein [Desulfobacteraceae bacterium]